MEDDPGAAEDERTIELSSVAAIYPELVIDPTNAYAASIDIPVHPDTPQKIYFQSSSETAPPILPNDPDLSSSTEKSDSQGSSLSTVNTAAANVDVHSIAHLPPLMLRISLPEGYPINTPPVIELSAKPKWIADAALRRLEEDCAKLWEEYGRDHVVFSCIDHVQQASNGLFGLNKSLDGSIQLPDELKLELLDFDLQCRRMRFERETFECGMCLEPKKGIGCHRLLLCGHVFCISCLQDYYNTCITEGDVDNVKCMSPQCGKEGPNDSGLKRKHDRTLNPSELFQIPISQEQVQRYVRLKRKKKLEADKATVYCPRQWCQGAAKSKKHPKLSSASGGLDDSDSEPDVTNVEATRKGKRKPEDIPMSERLCMCEDCNFAFCSVCKKSWHGELSICNPRRQRELDREEKASLAYLERFSTACPTCDAPSQKTHGCNHMICFRCKTHFCYLCSSYLLPDNPYKHFNDFKNTCYMRLWELEGGDGLDAGQAFDGGEGNAPAWEPEDFDTEPDDENDSGEEAFDDNDENDGLDFAEVAGTGQRAVPPPPPQRFHIEIVNFAGDGHNHRIELPERYRNQIRAPATSNPARVENGGQPGRRGRRAQPRLPRQPQIVVRAAVADQGAERIDELPNLPNAAPGQGNVANNLPAPFRAMGIERFLQLAQNDQEDEWDSDELDSDEEPPLQRPQRARQR